MPGQPGWAFKVAASIIGNLKLSLTARLTFVGLAFDVSVGIFHGMSPASWV